MTNRIFNVYFFTGLFAVTFLVFWPALGGPPVWDDITLWFLDPVMQKSFPYSIILTAFNWPLSVSVQKFLFALWGYSFVKYHVLNIILHFFCAYLFYRICLILKVLHARWLFVFFLFHPANVISVAWMIQIKTLLCFLLCALSFITLDRSLSDKRWIPLSWIFFLLSVLSKSASMPFSVIFSIYFLLKTKSVKSAIWIVPFLLISLLGIYRLLNSEVTREGVSQIESPLPPVTVVENRIRIVDQPTIVKKEVLPKPLGELTPDDRKIKSILPKRVATFFKAGSYYFWKSLFPLGNEPIKAKTSGHLGAAEYLFVVSLFLMIWLMKGKSIYLLCSLVAMAPFLGLITAPYMNVTLVSDQHMYLVLALLLIHWRYFMERLNGLISLQVPKFFFQSLAGAAVVFFLYLSFDASHFYSDELAFFKSSHEADPQNVPLVYNLAATYAVRGKKQMAYDVLKDLEVTEEVRRDPFYADIKELKQRLENDLKR